MNEKQRCTEEFKPGGIKQVTEYANRRTKWLCILIGQSVQLL